MKQKNKHPPAVETVQWKTITCLEYKDFALLELNLTKNGISNSVEFIEKLSLFLEIVEHKNPAYVLFNKRQKDFEIAPQLFEFTHKQLIDNLFNAGVKQILFLVTDSRYQKYQKGLNRKHIFAFRSKQKVFQHIEKQASGW